MILTKLRELTQAHVNADALMDELQKEAVQEQKKLEKAETTIRKKIKKLEQRKSSAEDKWLDGDWSKEKYHEVIERLDKELAEERQKLSKLIRDLPSREKLNLPQISKFIRLDKLDREMVQTLIKRIEIYEGGKVAITYNFAV
jgi:site-specific DNA recombinase